MDLQPRFIHEIGSVVNLNLNGNCCVSALNDPVIIRDYVYSIRIQIVITLSMGIIFISTTIQR